MGQSQTGILLGHTCGCLLAEPGGTSEGQPRAGSALMHGYRSYRWDNSCANLHHTTKLKRGSRVYERSCKIFIVKCYFVNFGHPSHLCGWIYRPLSFKKNQIFLRFLESDCGWERTVSK